MEKILAAVVGLAIASSAYGNDNLMAHLDMPLSISETSAVNVLGTTGTDVGRVDAPANWHMDELAGASLVGGYLLYRARRARII